jgi:hypothetical protein
MSDEETGCRGRLMRRQVMLQEMEVMRRQASAVVRCEDAVTHAVHQAAVVIQSTDCVAISTKQLALKHSFTCTHETVILELYSPTICYCRHN